MNAMSSVVSKKQLLPHPELSTAVGHVVRQCSNLEGLLSIFIGDLIGAGKEIGQIITAGLSFKALSSLLSLLFRHRVNNNTTIDKLDKLLQRAQAMQDRRNQIVHATWTAHDQPNVFSRMKMARGAKGLRRDHEMLDLDKLETEIEKMQTIVNDLALFLFEHVGQYSKKK